MSIDITREQLNKLISQKLIKDIEKIGYRSLSIISEATFLPRLIIKKMDGTDEDDFDEFLEKFDSYKQKIRLKKLENITDKLTNWHDFCNE